MKYQLFTQVALAQDIPAFGLRKGSIGTIVECYTLDEQEAGYSLEGLVANDTVEVCESQIEAIELSSPKMRQAG
jgi:hypothetical protein